jgi:benzoylformate decarboxylase
MAKLAGKHALLKMFEAEGVKHIFGNPGTSEAPMMDIMPDYPGFEYYLALQEGVAVGMAEGYARSTGKVPLVSLHIDNGMANGLSLMIDQKYSGTPMVLTAGNKDIRKLAAGRSDLAEMARPFAKWSTEITHAEQVPSVVRRAFQEARTAPTGPVFVAVSANAFDDVADVDILPSKQVVTLAEADEGAVREACEMIAKAERPILIVGDRVAEHGGPEGAIRLAETAGMKTYGHLSTAMSFPANHPLFQGGLNMRTPEAVKAVRDADVIVAAGCPVFEDFFFQPGQLVAADTKLIHIDVNSGEIGKSEPADLGILAAPGIALGQLADRLQSTMNGSQVEAAKGRSAQAAEQSKARHEAFLKLAAKGWNGSPMSPAAMGKALADAMPDDAVVFNDGVSTGGFVFEAIQPSTPGSYFGCRGQAIGWGMGATLGLKVANPDRPVIGVVGDGSAMMTVQGLYTAVNYGLPVIYVMCNNAQYRVLKVNMNHYHRLNGMELPTRYFGFDFPVPIDFVAQAKAYGARGKRVERAEDFKPALDEAIKSGETTVLDVVIDGAL